MNSSLSRSIALLSVMSRAIVEKPVTRPTSSRVAEIVRETSSSRPSFVPRTVSTLWMCSPRWRRATKSATSAVRSGGTRTENGWPMISAARYP